MSALLGLHGRRGSGKDTAFGFVQEWASERGLTAGRRGFADLLKQSFTRLFIPDASIDEAVAWCDELKKEESGSAIVAQWQRGDHYGNGGTRSVIQHQISGRTALQRFGTEAHRDVFQENFWVDALLPVGDLQSPVETWSRWSRNFMGPFDQEAPDICVVTDLRFENEAERIKLLNGKIWLIQRSAQKFTDSHQSEMPLGPEYIDETIHNDVEMDLDNFRRVVRDACAENFKELT